MQKTAVLRTSGETVEIVEWVSPSLTYPAVYRVRLKDGSIVPRAKYELEFKS